MMGYWNTVLSLFLTVSTLMQLTSSRSFQSPQFNKTENIRREESSDLIEGESSGRFADNFFLEGSGAQDLEAHVIRPGYSPPNEAARRLLRKSHLIPSNFWSHISTKKKSDDKIILNPSNEAIEKIFIEHENEEILESREKEEMEEVISESTSKIFEFIDEKQIEELRSRESLEEVVPEPIRTPDGVDPNNPEEIANREFYENTDGFDRIFSINKHMKVRGLKEGDIMPSRNRNAASDSTGKWTKVETGPDRGLVLIPYVISDKYNYTQIATIKSVMQLYARHTCIRFVPKTHEIASIAINDGDGCWAYVGKTGYPSQLVSLGIPGCVKRGVIAHEFMHVLGFQHEHSRSDRDKYVQILSQNIEKDMETNFEKYNDSQNFVIYDYNSVMHYSQFAFSKKFYLPSIRVKSKPAPKIGQRTRMSPYDIEEVKYLYNCEPGTYSRCGEDFVYETHGNFKSPNHPKPYPRESHCVWNFTAKAQHYISLTFQDINVHDSYLCQDDAIIIHDGKNASAPVLKTICGRYTRTIQVTGTGQSLYVIFSSDPKRVPNTGFRAFFRETTVQGKALPTNAPPTFPPKVQIFKKFSCNFDTDLCGMVQDDDDDLNWIRTNLPTPSSDTGPNFDHTSAKGSYLFVESSLPARMGDNAILRSPWISSKTDSCVSFAYHMFGAHMGTFRLYALEKKASDNYGVEVLLWEKNGDQGRNWLTHELTYSPKTDNVEAVQFYWEVYVFYYQSDVALDDVDIKSGSCIANRDGSSSLLSTSPPPLLIVWTTKLRPLGTTTEAEITTPEPITNSATTKPPALSKLNCSFDDGLCGWQQYTGDDFNWSKGTGSTPSHSTGPDGDHTSKNGDYLYIEASSPRRVGEVATLLSPLLTPQPHCLKLWYHMYGKQIGQLKVYELINSKRQLVAKLTGEKGSSWMQLSVDINYRGRPKKSNVEYSDVVLDIKSSSNAPGGETQVYVMIEASRASGYAGDIAIDDITITDNPCDLSTIQTSVPVILSEFACDFESSANTMCGMIQTTLDHFDWQLHAGETGSSGTGPSADSTKKDDSGNYIYIESSSPRVEGETAEISTPSLLPGQYCFNFMAHMWGAGTGSLKVFSVVNIPGRSKQNRKLIWELSGSQGDSWFPVKFNVTTSTEPSSVEFIFQARVGPSFTSDIALDDLKIDQFLCKSDGLNKVSKVKRKKSTEPTTNTTTISTTASISASTTSSSATVSLYNKTTTEKPQKTFKLTTIATTKFTSSSATPESYKTTSRKASKKESTKLKSTTPATVKQTTIQATTVSANQTEVKNQIDMKQKRTKTSNSKLLLRGYKVKVTTAAPVNTTSITTVSATTLPTVTVPTTTLPTSTVQTTTSMTASELALATSKPTTIKLTTEKSTSIPTTEKKKFSKSTIVPKVTSSKTTIKVQNKTTPTPTTTTVTLAKTTTTILSTTPKGKSKQKSKRPTPRIQTKIPVSTTAKTIISSLQFPSTFMCNFENGTCEIVQRNDDQDDWILIRGSTPSGGTGPTTDHTMFPTLLGHYIYMEASFPRQINDKAVIVTPKVGIKSTEICVSFWYHMFGNTIGEISAYAEFKELRRKKYALIGEGPERIFTQKGNQGQAWKNFQKTIKVESRFIGGYVKLQIHGTRGVTFQSDLGLDDICISDGRCGPSNACSNAIPIIKSTATSSTVTKNIATTTLTSTLAVKPLAIVSGMPLCTFGDGSAYPTRPRNAAKLPILPGSAADQGPHDYRDPGRFKPNDPMCGWMQLTKHDQFNWTRQSGPTKSRNTGPSSDHTTGSGHYLYIEASRPRKRNDIATLVSYPMYPTKYCLDTYYHMYGSYVGRLSISVLQKLKSGRRRLTRLASKTRNLGDRWERLKVDYSPSSSSVDVTFRIEGVVGNDYTSDIAIDDVAILPGQCDACKNPSHQFVNKLGQRQTFFTGCVNSDLFWVRCCSAPRIEKALYRRVNGCKPNMFPAQRLEWYCTYL